MNKILICFLFILILPTFGFAQLAPRLSSKIVNNKITVSSFGKTPFSISIKGKEIKTLESREDGFLHSIDGKILNITITKASVVLGKENISGVENLLKAHQKWELDFQSKFLFQKPLKVAEEETVFVNLASSAKQQTLFWYFNIPESSTNSLENHRIFQTALIGDVFLAIGSPLGKDDSITERRKLLMEIFSSLKLQPKTKQTSKGVKS